MFCSDCGEAFDDPETRTWKEKRPYGEGYAYETMGVDICPFCGSENIENYIESEDE